MKEHDSIRSVVAQTYTKAVARSETGSCCGTSDSKCRPADLSDCTGEPHALTVPG